MFLGQQPDAGNLGGEFSVGGFPVGHLECTMPKAYCAPSDAALDEQAEYIDDLWFLLHHSEDDDTVVLGLTSYLDDSGSDDGSKLVTIGGPVMSRIQFRAFSERWTKMLIKYQIEPPLHMCDFYNDGKYAGWYPEFKRALFLHVAKLINEHKLYSLSIAIPQSDFKSEFGAEISKDLIGPYAFAFFTAVASHQRISRVMKSGPLRIAYLVDDGFGQKWQLHAAHSVMVDNERITGGFRPTGALAFDTDDRVPALQGADVIAFASRKRELLDGALPEGFEPLHEVLSEQNITPHAHIPMPRDGLKMLADPIHEWILRRGSIPLLGEIVRPGRPINPEVD